MAETKRKLSESGENVNSKDREELENILDHIAEVDEDAANLAASVIETEVYKKPAGADKQPESLDGILEMISESGNADDTEAPGAENQSLSVWQKIVRFFVRLFTGRS